MELNPRLRFRSPMEIPFKIPKSITVLVSIGLFSKKFRRSATWRLQYVTIRCQLVSVVAAKNKTIIYLYSEFFETEKDEVRSRFAYQTENQDYSWGPCCRWLWKPTMLQRGTTRPSRLIGSRITLPFSAKLGTKWAWRRYECMSITSMIMFLVFSWD